MQLIDIGANLSDDSFSRDYPDVIQRARQAGVARMIITGASLSGSQRALELAREYPGELFATAGIHPHRASDYSSEVSDQLQSLQQQPEVVAVGETGLDYFRDISPRQVQRRSFEAHIEMACESGLPMFLHQREAHKDFLEILKTYRDQLQQVVVHCFTDSREALHDYLALDCHIGITGWLCDERRGLHLKAAVPDIPDNRLLVETDAPYLKPRNLRPKVRTHRNEPQWLPWIVGTLAACRNQTPEHIAAITRVNAERVFELGN